jgi:RNA polymerase sigma-70 factor (ECF subfamily)
LFSDDDTSVSTAPDEMSGPEAELLALFDRGLPEVYGYLLSRCGQRALAEELTSEAFMAAVAAVRINRAGAVTMPWLIGVARHKLADHWRRLAREERGLRVIADELPVSEDPWDVHLDALRARVVLERLAPHHRAALTLRYLDDLPVPEVAGLLDRTVHATEALLVRARTAFRKAYCAEGDE